MAIVDPLQEELELKENEELVDVNSLPDQPSEKKEEPVENVKESEEQPEEKQETSSIPNNPYAGKTAEELTKMLIDAQSELGRKGNQIGEYRKIIEENLREKVERANASPKEDVKVDIYDNPDEFVNQAISNNPTLAEMKEVLQQQKIQQVVDRMNSEHPDWKEIGQSPEFINWVEASPVRMELSQRFNASYDYNAANELLTTWKEKNQIDSKIKEMGDKERSNQLKAASTGGKGSAEPPTRKVYNNEDIINLMIRDPEKYRANVEEFDRALAEGRVIHKRK
jgi:hypothetical protein